MPLTCGGLPSPARRRKRRRPPRCHAAAGVEVAGGRGEKAVGAPGLRGSREARGPGGQGPPRRPVPGFQAGFSGSHVVFIYRDFEWPDHLVIAAALALYGWEIAWDGFYLWKEQWDSHPTNPEQSLPSPRQTQRGACVKFPSDTPICK